MTHQHTWRCVAIFIAGTLAPIAGLYLALWYLMRPL